MGLGPSNTSDRKVNSNLSRERKEDVPRIWREGDPCTSDHPLSTSECGSELSLSRLIYLRVKDIISISPQFSVMLGVEGQVRRPF